MTVVLALDGQAGLEAVPASGEATASAQAMLADVNLELDDGSAESNIGVGGGIELLFLNRFTPSPCDFSFDLEQVQVYFGGGTTNVSVGDDLRLVVYENTLGSEDPAVGANFLASFDVQVLALDAWNVYNLATPVTFNGPGDVLIGVIAMEVPGSDYFPAAIDQTVSQERSWAGWWSTSPPPDPPTLPPTSDWTLIDDVGFAGNWMIRGYGSYGAQVPAVVLDPIYQKGVADNNDVVQYDVTLTNCSGQEDTFDINYDGGWPVSGPDPVGPVLDGDVATFQVEVTVAGDAECTECDLLEVEAVAWSSPLSDTATIETCAAEPWQEETLTGFGVTAQPVEWPASTCTDAYSLGGAGSCFYVGGITPTGTVTGRAQMYDIGLGQWLRMTAAPTPVFGATLGYIDGKLYLAGGYTKLTDDWGGTYTLQIYDLATRTWTTGPAIPAWGSLTGAGGSNGAVLDGKLHVVGGRGDNLAAGSDQHAVYDPVGNSWTHLAPLPYTTGWFGATAGGGKLWVAGGYLGQNGFYAYDPASDSWEELALLPGGAGKKDPILGYAPDCLGGVFLYGGDKGGWSGIQDSTWYWHPEVNMWVEYPAALNTATTAAGGGYADGRLWIFGGVGAGIHDPPPHESLNYCCPPAPPVGAVEGLVTDANTGQPLEHAAVTLGGISDPDYYDQTWTDASGYYAFGPLLVDEYELEVAAYGYHNSDPEPVLIEEGVTKWVPFVLDAAMPELSPGSVGVNLVAGATGTYTATLANHGSGELNFHVSELPADSVVPIEDLEQTLAGSARIDPQVYADLDASADGTAKFIVYLAEQADLTEAFAIKDRSARGWYVYNALRATAEQSQAGLRAELDRGGVWFETRNIVNALVVKGDLDTVNSLAARPEVGFVGPNVSIPGPDPVELAGGIESVNAVVWNITKVRAPEVWGSFTDGTDVVVANIDTGVQWDHPALVNQYRGGVGNHDYHWWDATGDSPSVPVDTYGHGTHTMGTMVGDDGGANQIGMAPGAEWIACRASTGRSIAGEDLLECGDFILAPWGPSGPTTADPDMRPDVVNNSWGGGQAQWWYNQIVYAWRAAGIFPAFSSGNEGPGCETAGDPGDMANTISVGATDELDSNAPGSDADFSSRGPAAITGRIHPDVSAPGANVTSAYPGSTYGPGSGTSMAAPHVAGEVALVWSAQRDLKGNVQLTQWVIEQTAEPLPVDQGYFCGSDGPASMPNNQYGWGRIDAFEAVSLAINANWDVDWLVVAPISGTVAPAASADIELNFDTDALSEGCYNAHLKMEYNDPYVVEQFVPVAMCVGADWCLGPEDISVIGPTWRFVDQVGEFSYSIEPVTATLPMTIEWNNGTTDTVATYAWSATGTYTIIVTATNCEGTDPISNFLEVNVLEVDTTIYLPILVRGYHP
jgi:subtilisin family serine protease